MIWTAEQDGVLRTQLDNVKVAGALGVSIDSVRNRRKRLAQQEALAETREVPIEDGRIDFRAVEQGEYVGFNLAFYDIETTDLGAFMGTMLCASVGDSWGNVVTRRYNDFTQKHRLDDSGLAEWLRDTIEAHDMSLGWNSFQFDQSFLNARLLKAGKRVLADRMAIDVMWKASYGRYGARIGSRKLDSVAKFFHLEQQKTPLDWETWQLAQAGDQDALEQVVVHCEADVLVLRSAFNHLKPLIRTIHR